jgi:toxin-antitoxin system PIN domain toxin
MRALLDVNILIALLDSSHIHHVQATRWLGEHIDEGWASCPLTQNGCIRVMSLSAYPNTQAPSVIADLLREATGTNSHQFWPDRVSLLDQQLFDWSHLLNSRQITDAYLLALAVKHGGIFVTFDHAVPLRAVTGATEQHLVRI